MVKVIETNILYKKDNTTISDTQSRVIEVESLNEYVEEMRNREQIDRRSIIGNLHGVSFPKYATIEHFDVSDIRLICVIELFNGRKSLKTAYVCE